MFKKIVATVLLLAVALAATAYYRPIRGDHKYLDNLWVVGTLTAGTFAMTAVAAGASGVAGTFDIFPATASKGKIRITAADNAANHTIGITNASHGQTTIYTLQDCGQAAANFIVSQGAQTIAGIKSLTSLLNADGGIAVDTSNFTVSGTTGAIHSAGDFDIATNKFTVAAATGNTAIAGATTMTGAVTAGNNVTVTRTLGALASADTGWVSGVSKTKWVALSTGTNGAAAGKTLTTTIMDDSPTGEWTAIDADVVLTADATYARKGSNSLKLAVADAATAGDGATNTLVAGDQDYTDDESMGLWVYSTVALDSGDYMVGITDSVAGETLVAVPAVAANTWTWTEVDISAVANASKDVVTDLSFELSAAGAAKGIMSTYIDAFCKWDSTEEEALSTAILQGGCDKVFTVAGAVLVKDSDYFINYESGSDFLVWITDQSAATCIAEVAY